jgi:hypothetical protein
MSSKSNFSKMLKVFTAKYRVEQCQKRVTFLTRPYESFTKDELEFEMNRLQSKDSLLSKLTVVALILYIGAAYILGTLWQGLRMLALATRQGPIKVPTHIVSVTPFVYSEILALMCFLGPVILWLICFKLSLNTRTMKILGIKKLIQSKH